MKFGVLVIGLEGHHGSIGELARREKSFWDTLMTHVHNWRTDGRIITIFCEFVIVMHITNSCERQLRNSKIKIPALVG